jgi:sulfatase modifying factor 1
MLLIRWALLVGRNGDREWRNLCYDHDIGQNQPSSRKSEPEFVMNFASTKSPTERPTIVKHSPDDRMLYVPGGTYRMGSDRHYPEEAPVHRVTVDEFWMDRTPVTNRQFRKFVNATGYVTFAELKPDAKDYPDALPHMLKAGSLVFTPPKQAVDLRNWGQWWMFKFGAN